MNELFARKIAHTLDGGLSLSPEVVARLRVARERALERLPAPVAELALVGRGVAGLRPGGGSHRWLRILLPLLLLLAAAIGLRQWHESQQAAQLAAQQAAEIEEVDTGVLTGELPIKAYLDEEFQSWLKQSSQ